MLVNPAPQRRTFFISHKRTLLAILFVFLYSVSISLAVPPTSKYAPGATLDPTCAPNDTNCSVQVLADQTGSANTFLTTDGSDTAWSSSTLVLGGNFATSGAYATTLTATGITTLTLPTSGTLATTANINSAVSGTTNYLSKFTGTNTIGNSLIFDDGVNVGIGTTAPVSTLMLSKNAGTPSLSADTNGILTFGTGNDGITNQLQVGRYGTSPYGIWFQGKDSSNNGASTYPIILNPLGGNVGIGTVAPLSKLSINGGLHVGGDSDAGDNNLLVDGTTTSTGGFVGALTGNATTATTLQTTRTIWGQNFNGSANMTGALTGVTGITTSGGYTQSGSTANTFTGNTNLSASVNIGQGSVSGANNITMNGGTAGTYGVSLGWANTVGSYASAIGWTNTASASHTTAIGRENTANADYSSAIGYANTASGLGSLAVNSNNTASGVYSFAAGQNSIASGSRSVAIGNFARTGAYAGTFIFTDNQTLITTATAANQFYTRFIGGYVLNTDMTAGNSMSFSPGGKLLIGSLTDDGANKLQVTGSSKFTGNIATTGGYTQSGTTANSFTGTSTFSNATYSALFTGGNVGIGTTSPSQMLSVGASNQFTVSSVGAIIGASVNGLAVSLGGSSYTSNVAVGLSTLASNTGVANTAIGSSALASHTSNGYNTGVGYTSLYSNITGSGDVAIGANAGRYETGSNSFYVNNVDQVNTAGDKAYSLLYGTFSGTAGSLTGQQLVINGNVGIGTTSPNFKLTVSSGNTTFETPFEIINTNTTIGAATTLVEGLTSTTRNGSTVRGSIFLEGVATSAQSDMVFATNTNGTTVGEKMRIMSGGNVGIGTADPLYKLSIGAPTATLPVYANPSSGHDQGFIRATNTDVANNYLNVLDIGMTAATDATYGGTAIRFITQPRTTPFAPLERMRIDMNGNVGIGTTSPSSKLSVRTDNGNLLRLERDGTVNDGGLLVTGYNNTWSFSTFDDSTTYNNVLSVDNGRVNIGIFGAASDPVSDNLSYVQLARTRSTFYTLAGIPLAVGRGTNTGGLVDFFYNGVNLVGGISTNGSSTSYNTTSDRRLKENIVPTLTGLETLMQIEVRDYAFISDSTHTLMQGFIAQDLYAVYPQAVTVGGSDVTKNPWQVDYGRLTPLIVQSVQELGIIVTALPDFEDQTLAAKVATFLEGIANDIADIGRVRTRELCVGEEGDEVCITKEQLREIMNNGSVSSSGGNQTSSPVTEPAPTDTAVPAVQPDPVVTEVLPEPVVEEVLITEIESITTSSEPVI